MLTLDILLTWQLYTRQVLPVVPEYRVATEEIVEEPEPILGAGFRQTFYSVIGDKETKLGYIGLTPNHKEIRNIDNVMHFYDNEYGWLPVIAVDIDAVVATGLNNIGTYNAYGSVLEIDYQDGTCEKAIVLDACGACAIYDRIDLWVYGDNYVHDKSIEAIKTIRRGFGEDHNEQNDTEANQNAN